MENKGEFLKSLVRSNKQIREDRAASIGRQANVIYKRMVEDLELDIQQMEQDRENMLDLSPTNAQSLMVASDFKAGEWATKDYELSMKIRNSKIRLEVIKQRYEYLFQGSPVSDAPITDTEFVEEKPQE